MPPPLFGAHILLRYFRMEDVADVFAYASDPEVTRFAEWQPHRTPHDSAAYIRRCLQADQDTATLAVEHRALRRVIGAVDIRVVSRLRRTGEIGYTIARPFWGQGINTEAGRLLLDFGFGELRLARIRAVCDVANRRSYRTMEKLGMLRDQIIPKVRYRNGIPVDRYQYSILRQEWERHRQRSFPPGTSAPAA